MTFIGRFSSLETKPWSPSATASTNQLVRDRREVAMKRLPVSVGCPVELSLVLLSGKWKPVILARLKDGAMRYADLRRLIPGLSDKVLTQRLGDLQTQGLISRDTSGGATGLYTLTAKGQALRPLLEALYDWGVQQAVELKIEVRSTAS
jgi:DNA-binding HxlR family transcriptional regulator